MAIFRPIFWLAAVLLLATPFGKAQAQDEAESSSEDDSPLHSVIGEDIAASPRAEGMGFAVSPLAEDLDALCHNPANIGGLNPAARERGWARNVFFPALSAGANKNATNLNNEFRDADSEATAGKAVLDAHGGKRQYGRAGAGIGLGFGRAIVYGFTDRQVAAVPTGTSGAVDLHYRSISGVAYGISIADAAGRLALGYSGWTITREDTEGVLTYAEVVNNEYRARAIERYTSSYSGTVHNAGLNLSLDKKGRTHLSLVSKGMSGSGYTAASSESAPERKVESDLVLGFAYSPNLTRSIIANLVTEFAHLDNHEIQVYEKVRVGAELALGSIDDLPVLALRGGVSSVGASFGLGINLGLIDIQLAANPVDISTDNTKAIDYRYTATLIINAAAK